MHSLRLPNDPGYSCFVINNQSGEGHTSIGAEGCLMAVKKHFNN